MTLEKSLRARAPDPERRSLLRSACRHCLGIAALAGAAPVLGQAAAPAPAASLVPQRFARPSIDTDEGGLWAMMDREEARLRRSPFTIRDPALGSYLRDLVCKLTDDHCPDIRIHAVRTPLFNASMSPNGMMQVWSGLLLRVENEAQLAAVLGHELGHYLERHSIERLRDVKSRAAFAQFMGMFGVVGAIGQLGVIASMFAFSREHETRADRLGMQLLARAGYDGREAAKVWENLLGEARITGGADVGRRSPMMATHPPIETRRDDLLALAGDAGGKLNAAEYGRVILPHRMGWLQDEIRRGQYEESIVLFDRMLRDVPGDAQAMYARGEVYRQRAGDNDMQRSLDDLTRATGMANPPAEAFRALGLVHKQQTNGDAAVTAFEKYLTASPDAADAGLIKTYISQLKP
ncbi:MAG: M48 family metallopeptidase [Pseudomonadota bacterium]